MPTRDHLAQCWRDTLHLVSGWYLGIVWLSVLLPLLVTSASVVVVLVGFPLLAATTYLTGWAAALERRRAALVTGAPLPPVAPVATSFFGRLRDRQVLREAGGVLLVALTAVLAGSALIVLDAAGVAALAAPLLAALHDEGWIGGLGALAVVGLALGGAVLLAGGLLVARPLALAVVALTRWALVGDADRAAMAERIEELTETRAGAVESADAALRRIERDLHDGAQHRLAYVALQLGRARSKLGEDDAEVRAILDGAHEESKRAMTELRDLVRGVHPTVLEDRGLDAAISGLAARTGVPVDVTVDLPARLPVAVETAAYFVVAEALTNVAKHARAATATVRVTRNGTAAHVEVCDDGRGGAAAHPGSGLAGLQQRVAALDGALTIDSPRGGPTRLRAVLPCGS